MAYATEADIVELYGQDQLTLVADRDGDGIADPGVVARALAEASEEIDLYLGRVVTLPLAETLPSLRRLAIEISLYRMSSLDGAVRTSEHRRRYEDALDLLQRIADGKVRLDLPADPDADPDGLLDGQGANPVVLSGPPRLFTRDKLRDV